MLDDEITEVASGQLLVLYADISGSTHLFEEFGDTMARDATARCIEVMSEVVARFEGRVVKTIGDEILAVFRDAARGAMAGTDLQGAVRRASEEGRFATGALRIKVGLHFGSGIEAPDDVFGDAPIIARQIIGLAKADQVLTSRETLDALPPMLRMNTRFVDRIPSERGGAEIEVLEFIWEVSDLTQSAEIDVTHARDALTAVLLTYAGETVRCDAAHPVVTIGRVAGNDLVVATDLTSRQHAEVEWKAGRIRITDNSANGTLVESEERGATSLRREHASLRGRGRICLGGSPETNPDGIVEFRCE